MAGVGRTRTNTDSPRSIRCNAVCAHSTGPDLTGVVGTLAFAALCSVPGETMDLPAVLFRWPPLHACARMHLGLARRDRLQPARAAILALGVKQRRLRRRSALPRQRSDIDHPFQIADPDREHVPEPQRARGLCRFSVQSYLAAVHGLGREAARLEKTRRPEPFVDAQGFFAHANAAWYRRSYDGAFSGSGSCTAPGPATVSAASRGRSVTTVATAISMNRAATPNTHCGRC